jgi:uroporphyrin-3 C-methyltransferase
MTDEDPKPGVVIDVTPNQGTDRPDDTSFSARTRRGSNSERGRTAALPLALALLSVLSVAAAGYFGYRHWSDLTREMAALDARVTEQITRQQQLQAAVDNATETVRLQESTLGEQREVLSQQRVAFEEARAAFRQQEQKLVAENLRLEEREAELRAVVADVHRRVGSSGIQWMIAETEYLLRIAIHRLTLARDTDTARVALELADQRLRDTRDPGWTGVREQIARDIAKLSAFEAPDSAGLASRLTALIGQIPHLGISSAVIGPKPKQPATTERPPGERSWATLVDDLWSGFKETVRIREHDAPVQTMLLAPEHAFFLYENLKLHLEAARLGIARGDQALYQDNLRIAAGWLDRYFDPSDNKTAALRQAIDEMRAIEIRPELPDISLSLRALQARQELMRDVAPDRAEKQ